MSAAASNHGEEKPARGQSIRGRSALDSLPRGSRTTGEQALARSRLVRRLRVALPLLALALMATFFFTTKSNTVDEAFLDDFKDISASTGDKKMANPRFAGVDEGGRPFEITAESATQVANSREIVDLEMPRATQGDGEEATVVTADKGLYQSETNILKLKDNVTLSHDIGANTFVLRAPEATVSIKEEVVTSNTGVDGESTGGDALTADRMTAYTAEGRVIFEGNVRMRIYPESAKRNRDEENRTKPETTEPETDGEETSEQQ
jgi:lipopolysaccharide export system protein LptC